VLVCSLHKVLQVARAPQPDNLKEFLVHRISNLFQLLQRESTVIFFHARESPFSGVVLSLKGRCHEF
jgi:hypothetical protein